MIVFAVGWGWGCGGVGACDVCSCVLVPSSLSVMCGCVDVCVSCLCVNVGLFPFLTFFLSFILYIFLAAKMQPNNRPARA